MPTEVTWEDTNRIGILLCNAHPNVEPHKVPLGDVHSHVIALSEFKGDPKHFHEPTLEAVRMAWSTEFQERTRNWA